MTGWRRPDAYIDFIRDRMAEEAAENAPYSRTMIGAFTELNLACRNLWLTIMLDLRQTPLRPLAERCMHRMAARYQDHPDYSEWWRS